MARHKMAKASGKKRKSSGAKRSRPRRRVGASGKLEPVLMDALAVGGGIVGMRELSILVGGVFPSSMASPMITGLVQVGIGGVLAWKSKNGFLRYVGLGGAGNGLMTILNGAGVIGAGPQTMTYAYQNRRVMGDPRLQFVAGPTTRIGDVGSYPNNFSAVAGPRASRRRYTS